MCTNEKICFQDPTFNECDYCDKLNELVRRPLHMSYALKKSYYIIFWSALLKSFNKDLNSNIIILKEPIMDLLKKRNNRNYCYKDYMDTLYVKISDSLYINERNDDAVESIYLYLLALLIDLFGEIDKIDNELYLLHLETHPKPISLDLLQIYKKYIDKTTSLTEVKARRGQNELRKILLTHNGKCKICGITIHDLLELSHIKPWADSNDIEKLDIYNVLLLAKHLSVAFDKGYISFNDDGTIIISSKLDEFNKKLLSINEDIKIELEEGHLKYLKYHRENRFKK